MTENKFKNLIAFCVLMENNEGILKKSPDYVIEKFNRYIGQDLDEFNWGLDVNNKRKLEAYMFAWGHHLKFNEKKDE